MPTHNAFHISNGMHQLLFNKIVSKKLKMLARVKYT